MEETTWNKLQIQSQENIYVRRHLQGRGLIASAALQAAHLDTVHNREHIFFCCCFASVCSCSRELKKFRTDLHQNFRAGKLWASLKTKNRIVSQRTMTFWDIFNPPPHTHTHTLNRLTKSDQSWRSNSRRRWEAVVWSYDRMALYIIIIIIIISRQHLCPEALQNTNILLSPLRARTVWWSATKLGTATDLGRANFSKDRIARPPVLVR